MYKVTTDVVYVSRTCDYLKRQYSHQLKKNANYPKTEYTMIPIATGLTLSEARALEQTIITAYGIDTLNNMINSISLKKWSYFKHELAQMKNLIKASFDPE